MTAHVNRILAAVPGAVMAIAWNTPSAKSPARPGCLDTRSQQGSSYD